ncbi:hypothetical protein GCWU000325_00723 [Alloprevotella tannerae ATCC 51259]|uniref:Uncharacterized protein n=1 Tax=Alloprevotella tannerae ATCC 51259 TaxID=626522 RepID=C9LEU2_9BACT|nr:hypothetical protein GCWU000325_00723 [Alloprevotella tannerae ATCC 51259]
MKEILLVSSSFYDYNVLCVYAVPALRFMPISHCLPFVFCKVRTIYPKPTCSNRTKICSNRTFLFSPTCSNRTWAFHKSLKKNKNT